MTPTQFINKQYMYSSFKERVLPYLTDKESNQDVIKYTFPKDMLDSELQKECGSTPIPVEIFADVVMKFTEKADKEKDYIFHVQTPKEVLACNLYWGCGGWGLYDYDFDCMGPWSRGGVFLSLATETKDTLTLESFVSELETLIKKYRINLQKT